MKKLSVIFVVLTAFSFISCASTVPLTTNVNKKVANKKAAKEQSLSFSDSLLNYGLGYINTPYRYGAKGPNSFDCSGFTSYVFRHFGYNLEHSSRSQAAQLETVRKSNLQKGDLVFFEGRRRNGVVGHAGIVLGLKPNGEFDFLHASVDKGVTISSSEQPYYAARFVKGGRVFSRQDSYTLLSENANKPAAETMNKRPAQNISPVSEKADNNHLSITHHTVKRGETLSDISQKYDMPIAVLKRLNSLESNRIKKGMKLIVREPAALEVAAAPSNTEKTAAQIPATSAAAVQKKQEEKTKNVNTAFADTRNPTKAPTDTSEEVIQPATQPADNRYAVQAGETLFAIAKKHNLTVQKLKDLNNLVSDRLLAGQILNVGKAKQVTERRKVEELPTTTTVAAQPKATAETRYKVKAGETLFGIAAKYGITIHQLKKRNNLTSDRLSAGQTLLVPSVAETTPESAVTPSDTAKITNAEQPDLVPETTKHTVGKGENLHTIGRKYHCTPKQIKKWNSLSTSSLQIGQKLIIRK